MGLKDWYNAQDARYKESISAIGGFYGAYALHKGDLLWDFRKTKRPIAGAVAVPEAGIADKSPTLTRVVGGAILAGPAGAIVGGLFQKDKSRFYVTVTFSDESAVIIEGPAKDESKMRRFAEKINAASRYYAKQAV